MEAKEQQKEIKRQASIAKKEKKELETRLKTQRKETEKLQKLQVSECQILFPYLALQTLVRLGSTPEFSELSLGRRERNRKKEREK